MEKGYRRIAVAGKKVNVRLLVPGADQRPMQAESVSLEKSGVVVLRNVDISGGPEGIDILLSPPYFLEVKK